MPYFNITWPPPSGGTWSNVLSLTNSHSNMVTDGTFLYTWADKIAKIDPDTLTETAIRNSAQHWSGQSECAVFNGELYACDANPAAAFEVWKYDGTGTSWTQVFSGTGTDGFSRFLWVFDYDGTETLICVGQHTNSSGTATKVAAKTTDGSAWSVLTHPEAIYFSGVPSYLSRVSSVADAAWQWQKVSGGALQTYRLSGTSWVAVAAESSVPDQGPQQWWKSGFQYTLSVNPFSWQTPTESTIEPLPTHGTSNWKLLGDNNAGTIRFWDDATNQWYSTPTDSIATGGVQFSHVCILSDGRAFASITSGSALFQRGTDFDGTPAGGGPTAGTAKFYYDINALTERADMPFGLVNPGCMAVRGIDGKVALGGDGVGAGGELVITKVVDDNYVANTDITDSHSVANPINGVGWINGN